MYVNNNELLRDKYTRMLIQTRDHNTLFNEIKKSNRKSTNIISVDCLTIDELPELEKSNTVFIWIKNTKEIPIINHLILLGKNIFIENPNVIIGYWNKLKYPVDKSKIVIDYSFIDCIDYNAIQIKNYLDSKKHGNLLMLQSHNMCKNKHHNYKCIYDAIIPNIISTIWLFTEMPEMVNAITNKIQHKYNDFISTTLEFKNNKIAIVSSDLIMHFNDKNFSVICDNGTITYHSLLPMYQHLDQYVKYVRSAEIQKFLSAVELNNHSVANVNKMLNIENIINAIVISSKKYIPIYLDIEHEKNIT